MYFAAHNANVALKILTAAGHAAERVSASRRHDGVRYLISVKAPHLPKLNNEVRTVQLRTPNELLGWGATDAEVRTMTAYELCC